MDIWTTVAIAFGFGAFAGVAKLVESKRELSARVYSGVVLSCGLGGLVMGLASAMACTIAIQKPIDTGSLIMAALLGGYGGASKAIQFVQRRDEKPRDGE